MSELGNMYGLGSTKLDPLINRVENFNLNLDWKLKRVNLNP